MQTLDMLENDAVGTTYYPLKNNNKRRAIRDAIKLAKRAAATVIRRKQRINNEAIGDWLYLINERKMSVDEIIEVGLVEVISSRADRQFASAKASLKTATDLQIYIADKITEKL